MIRCGALAVALLLSAASDARAQVNLAWNKCLGLPGSADLASYACDGSRHGQPFTLVASFVAPAGVDSFYRAEVIIKIQTDRDFLQDWWHLGTGECRAGNLALTAPSAFTSGAGCLSPWAGSLVAQQDLASWESNYYTYPWDPSRGRSVTRTIRAFCTPLVAGQHYVATELRFDNGADVGPGACTGCATPVTFWLAQVEIDDAQPTGTVVHFLHDADVRDHVYWQGDYTPARRTTWGAIKATYR